MPTVPPKRIDVNKLWSDIGEFEENEVRVWKSNNALLTEARSSARMQAYVELVDRTLDKRSS